MWVDLHIHSALSPCANDDMTPNNIVNMSIIKGLDLICVCDHNSARNQRAVAEVARELNMNVIFGIEVCSSEEVHLCTYFRNIEDVEAMGLWVESKWLDIKNNVDFFGHQWVFNSQDEVIDELPISLSFAITATIEEILDKTHEYHGKCVYAHAMNKSHGVLRQLGLFPQDVDIDGIESRNFDDECAMKEKYPQLRDKLWLRSSDAHQLSDILEQDVWIHSNKWKKFWGDEI